MLCGCFLVVGHSSAPALHLLASDQLSALRTRMRLAYTDNGKALALSLTFGKGTAHAFPAWDAEAMAAVAAEYDGPYAPETRAMAQGFADGGSGGNGGGGNAPVMPKPSAPSGPVGALFPEFEAASVA